MRRALVAVLLFLAVSSPAGADVVDKGANGFTLRTERTMVAPPERLWGLIVHNVGEWWDKDHTYSGDSKNLSIIAEPGGCFCEALENGGVEHAIVVYASAGELLRMKGALGPLQALGVSGSLTFAMEKSGSGSKLTVTYAVGGYMPGGLDKAAGVVDSVLTQQVERLKSYVEKATPR